MCAQSSHAPHLVFFGPGRIGQAILPTFMAQSFNVTVRSRREYGDFLERSFNPTAAIEALPSCDVAIFCAGLFELNAAPERMLQANYLAIKALAEALHQRFPAAHIITFLDARIQRSLETVPESIHAYLQSKQALAQWTLEAALKWGREGSGTRVNAIAPGPVLPPPSKAHSEKAGECLTPRPTPNDIAHALEFLITTPSITGQILYLAAGQQLF